MKCIKCGKEITCEAIVSLTDSYKVHLECWAELIPDTTNRNSSKEEKEKRTKIIHETAKNLINEYEKQRRIKD